jgi:glucosamine-6-phosphate deaminase
MKVLIHQTSQTATDCAAALIADRLRREPDVVLGLAITMGIGIIMRAQEVILLTFGAAKADVVARMVEGPVSASCPASVLQMHRNVTVVLDEAASQRLALRDYYELVHPHVPAS